jgi:hypothetical protein
LPSRLQRLLLSLRQFLRHPLRPLRRLRRCQRHLLQSSLASAEHAHPAQLPLFQ